MLLLRNHRRPDKLHDRHQRREVVERGWLSVGQNDVIMEIVHAHGNGVDTDQLVLAKHQ